MPESPQARAIREARAAGLGLRAGVLLERIRRWSRYADEGEVGASQARWASELGCTDRQVRRVVAALRGAGLIETRHGVRQGLRVVFLRPVNPGSQAPCMGTAGAASGDPKCPDLPDVDVRTFRTLCPDLPDADVRFPIRIRVPTYNGEVDVGSARARRRSAAEVASRHASPAEGELEALLSRGERSPAALARVWSLAWIRAYPGEPPAGFDRRMRNLHLAFIRDVPDPLSTVAEAVGHWGSLASYVVSQGGRYPGDRPDMRALHNRREHLPGWLASRERHREGRLDEHGFELF